HVDDGLALGREEAPEVAGTAATAAEMKDGIGESLWLVHHALAEAVERDPRHRDAVARQHPRLQRIFRRQRLEIRELRPVVHGDRRGRQRDHWRHGLTGGIEQALRFLAEPEVAWRVE